MRLITTILALGGSIWAYMGLGSFVLIYWLLNDLETMTSVLKLGFVSILIPSGYFVWWGWVFYSFKKRFPLVAQRTFWIVSLIHHVIGIIFIILWTDDWGSAWWILTWIIANIIVAAAVLVCHPGRKINTEQVAT